MNTTQICDQCGASLPDDSPRGLCPACMMRAALQTTLQSADDRSASETSAETPATNSVPAPGARLNYFGDYELLEKIAQGGMGVVYKARQVSLNRVVAVKMILAGQLANEMEVKRFRLEAEAAANLQHPNIVAIHEVGSHEGQDYFSMDFVPGQNLADAVADGPIEARRAAGWVATIAEAIQYAHQRGILHRDLKPQNVLLDERAEPRVTDFGLAKRLVVPPSGGSGPVAAGSASELTVTGAVMGSPSYMAPEQAAGRQGEISPGTDVYALGAILYCLITGKAPFTDETAVATLVKVLNEEPPAPRKLNPAIPVDLENVCLKCLEKKPERRYATARALAEDLQRFLNHEPVLARPVSAARKVWSWSRRHPWVMVLGLTVALFVLLGAVFWLQTENDFLRFKSDHPGSAPPAGVMLKRMEAIFHFLALSLVSTMIAAGCLLLIGAVTYRTQNARVRRFMNAAVFQMSAGWVFGAILLAHGVLMIRQSVEAHIWEGTPLLLPLSMGFALLLGGFGCVVEALLQRQQCLLSPERSAASVHFLAGLAELKRGDLKGFWKNSRTDVDWKSLSRFRFTPLRILNVLWMGALAFWIGDGGEYGNHAIWPFLINLAAGVFLNGLYLAAKTRDMTRFRAAVTGSSFVVSQIGVALVICNALMMIHPVIGPQIAHSILRDGLLGMVLGLAASFQLLHWRIK